MSKTKIIVTILVLIVLISGGGTAIYLTTKPKEVTKSQASFSITPIPASIEKLNSDKTYTDASGFSFGYPNTITVSDITPDDKSYYTQLSLKKDNSSELKITVKDTNSIKIEDWLNSDSLAPKDASLYGATTLGKIPAKQYVNSNTFYTIAIDQGVLYLIEGKKDGGFWENLQNLIVQNFTFAGSNSGSANQGSTRTSQGNLQNIIYEPDEIVQ